MRLSAALAGSLSTLLRNFRPLTAWQEPLACNEAILANAGKFVVYYQVSTRKQGRSGFGLEAQREAVLS
jgi:hypothetical protein